MKDVHVYRQGLSVPYDFPVIFARGVLAPDNPLLADTLHRLGDARRHRVAVFVDHGLAAARPDLLPQVEAYLRARADLLEAAAPPFLVPGGESCKQQPEVALALARRLLDLRMDRHSHVVILGGGAVLDAVGFAASLVHRGLRIVRMPSTVLAQNDAGVGVKTGVNVGRMKNALGTFAPPFAVVNDLDLLDTLPPVAWTDGIAEAFKVSIIKDAVFFRWLAGQADALRARDRAAMERLVLQCAALHLDHIREGGDPFEFGRARPLDFGHWSAHWLEAQSDYTVSHGHAVALGLLLDSRYAMHRGWLDAPDFEAIRAGLAAAGFPAWHGLLARRSGPRLDLLHGLADFREHLGGELCLTFPRGLGARHEVHEMDEALLERCLDEMRAATEDPRRS